MRNIPYIAAVSLLSVLLLILSAPQGLAAGPPGTSGPATGGGTTSVVAEAIVVGIDPPENCLRIRRGPSLSYQVIGCAKLGDKLPLTGVFSSDNRWAQLKDNGWVFTCQIKTDFKPPGPPVACGTSPRQERSWSGPATSGDVVFPRTFPDSYDSGHFYRRYNKHWGFWQGHHGHKK